MPIITRSTGNKTRYSLIFLCVWFSACSLFPSTVVSHSPTSPLSKSSKVPLSHIQVIYQIPPVSVSFATHTKLTSEPFGMSVEFSSLCQILSLDATLGRRYEQMFRTLGGGELHLGGHTSDLTVWQPNGSYSCAGTRIVVTKTLVNSIFIFAARIGWHVTWPLNLAANDPDTSAHEASYVASQGGEWLSGFTIGNEPELYVSRGERPSTWNVSNYLYEWKQIHDAVVLVVPQAQFIGPDTCCGVTFFDPLLDADAPILSMASHHYYIHRPTGVITPETLLDQSTSNDFTNHVIAWLAVAQAHHLRLNISESNTLSNGGLIGVSNSFAASLWAIETLLYSLSLGVVRIDFQQSVGASYDVFADDGTPQSLYYSLLFVHEATAGTQTTVAALSPATATTASLDAYAISASGTSFRLALLNRSAEALTVTLHLSDTYRAVSFLSLTAPMLSATLGITFGGATINTQGNWSPHVSSSLALHGTSVSLAVPADTALLLTFQK